MRDDITTVSRRGLLVGAGAGIALAAPAIARPAGLVRMRGESFSIDGYGSAAAAMMRWDRTVGLPGVRLVFADGNTTRWFAYPAECVRGNRLHTHALRMEICTWAPNGMRAITEVPIDIAAVPEPKPVAQRRPATDWRYLTDF